jgi:pilus assembly protein CpaB
VEVLNTSSLHGQLTAGFNCQGPHQQQLGAHTRMLLPKVEVLSLGPANGAGHGSSSNTSVFSRTSTDGPSAASAAAVNSVTVTFAVTQAELVKLVLVAQTGLPYLALIH